MLASEEPAGYTTTEEPAGCACGAGPGPGAGPGAGERAGGEVSVQGLLEEIGEALGQLAGLPLGGALDDTQLVEAHTTLTALLARVHRERLRALAEIDERAALNCPGSCGGLG